jgi:hypothetical protein
MSAVPVYRPEIRTKPEPQARPVSQPKATPARKPSAKAQARAVRAEIKRRVLHFSLVAFAAFMVSSLVGNVMLESVRRSGIAAASRTREAIGMKSALQRQVAAVANMRSAEEWAQANGFVAADSPAVPSSQRTYVASR